MPERIQFKRKKGFRMREVSTNPNGCVKIARPGKFGNPFKIGMWIDFENKNRLLDSTQIRTAKQAVVLFEMYLLTKLEDDPNFLDELKDKDVACFCPIEKICHGDILLEYANK